jgi:ribosomal protein L11 methyltransferase
VIRLAVRCRPELAERVLAELVELAPGGVEEDRGESYVEYAIYGAPGEVPALPDLEAAAGEGLVEIETSDVPDDWADRWRDFHLPIELGGRLVVRPSWATARGALATPSTVVRPRGEPFAGARERAEDPAPVNRAFAAGGPPPIDVVIDPGQAFGTGGHATTQLCLELLLELEAAGEARGALSDWGTGSGVLAIAAAKLGWAPIEACDREQAALEAAGANAAANGVAIGVRRVDLREERAPVAPTVLANLTAPILRTIAERLAREGRSPRRMVCSGALVSEVDEVAGLLGACGLRERRRRFLGDWAALLLSAE